MGFQGDDPDEIIQVGQGPGMTRREYEAWGKGVPHNLSITNPTMKVTLNPPDANGVRTLTDERVAALSGAYDMQFVTPDALPDGALVYGRWHQLGRLIGYFVLVSVKGDS